MLNSNPGHFCLIPESCNHLLGQYLMSTWKSPAAVFWVDCHHSCWETLTYYCCQQTPSSTAWLLIHSDSCWLKAHGLILFPLEKEMCTGIQIHAPLISFSDDHLTDAKLSHKIKCKASCLFVQYYFSSLNMAQFSKSSLR